MPLSVLVLPLPIQTRVDVGPSYGAILQLTCNHRSRSTSLQGFQRDIHHSFSFISFSSTTPIHSTSLPASARSINPHQSRHILSALFPNRPFICPSPPLPSSPLVTIFFRRLWPGGFFGGMMPFVHWLLPHNELLTTMANNALLV